MLEYVRRLQGTLELAKHENDKVIVIRKMKTNSISESETEKPNYKVNVIT